MSHYSIPESELEFSFVRSSGPGGQNVNKVNSKAVLRWNLARSPSLWQQPVLRARLLSRLASRLSAEGELVVASDKFRDQHRNRADCVEKLEQIIAEASHVPKARKETKPSRSSQRRAAESKRRHSAKKGMRRAPRFE